jgi:hypothetical protein
VRARVIKDAQEMAQAAAGIAPDVRLARPGVQRTADLLGAGDLAEYAANPRTPPGSKTQNPRMV